MKLIRQVAFLIAASLMAACSTSQPASVGGVDRVIGDELPGAQGVTIADQNRIDDTVARACAAGLYTSALCDIHTVASAERRRDLAGRMGAGV